MRKMLMLAFILGCLICQTALAAFHSYETAAGTKSIDYFLMSQLTYSYNSSALNFNFGVDENRSAEISLLGYRSAYILTNSSYQLGLLGKQRLVRWGKLSFTGVLGLGALYSSAAGVSASGDVGGILGFEATPELRFSSPVIASIFSDGILLDYSAGVSYRPAFLGGKEVVLGAKGVFMGISTGDFMGLQNSFYGMVGLRANI